MHTITLTTMQMTDVTSALMAAQQRYTARIIEIRKNPELWAPNPNDMIKAYEHAIEDCEKLKPLFNV